MFKHPGGIFFAKKGPEGTRPNAVAEEGFGLHQTVYQGQGICSLSSGDCRGFTDEKQEQYSSTCGGTQGEGVLVHQAFTCQNDQGQR